MKPTLWYSKWYDQEGEWICSYLEYQIMPPEGTEEFIKWACAGAGSSPQEAYANWEHECDLFREELNSDKSNS